MYLTNTWSDLLACADANIYGTKVISLPEFESYVVFTGNRQEHPKWLSFRDIFFPNGKCNLDFKVQCIYKNNGEDNILQQYIEFANIWDEQSQRSDKEHLMNALRKTLEICLERDILTQFIIKRRAEIIFFDRNEITYQNIKF